MFPVIYIKEISIQQSIAPPLKVLELLLPFRSAIAELFFVVPRSSSRLGGTVHGASAVLLSFAGAYSTPQPTLKHQYLPAQKAVNMLPIPQEVACD